MIELLGAALAVPVVLGLLTLGMERVERRVHRVPTAQPVRSALPARPARPAPRSVATRPYLTRAEIGLP